MFEITRRDPFTGTSLRDLIRTITEDVPLATFGEEGTGTGMVPVDISQTDSDIIVRASMPGFDKDDIDVQIHNGVLSIVAKHEEETETKEERYYRRERRVGSMSRRVALPGVVDEAEADAELKNGVLTLTIPLPKVAKPKQIKVK